MGTEKDRKENRELKGKSQEEGGMKVTEEGGIEGEWNRAKRKEIKRRGIERNGGGRNRMGMK